MSNLKYCENSKHRYTQSFNFPDTNNPQFTKHKKRNAQIPFHPQTLHIPNLQRQSRQTSLHRSDATYTFALSVLRRGRFRAQAARRQPKIKDTGGRLVLPAKTTGLGELPREGRAQRAGTAAPAGPNRRPDGRCRRGPHKKASGQREAENPAIPAPRLAESRRFHNGRPESYPFCAAAERGAGLAERKARGTMRRRIVRGRPRGIYRVIRRKSAGRHCSP